MTGELEFIVYSTLEEDIRINAVVKDESIWLTQKGMAELTFILRLLALFNIAQEPTLSIIT